MLSQKINEIIKNSKISPIIVTGISAKIFNDAVILDAMIDSKELGIINTKEGPKYPAWFLELKKSSSKQLIINSVDEIDEYEQGKFYEMLKFKQISNIDLPKNTGIIVIAKDTDFVADSLKNLCMIKNL